VAPAGYFRYSHGNNKALHEAWSQRVDSEWDRLFPENQAKSSGAQDQYDEDYKQGRAASRERSKSASSDNDQPSEKQPDLVKSRKH
jgi:hypothetical protein